MNRRWEVRLLVVCVTILVVMGIAATYSAASLSQVNGLPVTERFVVGQVMAVLLGGIVSVFAATTDYRRLQRLAPWGLGLAMLAVLCTVLPGLEPVAPRINGARRWLLLGPLRVQPSEVLRLALLVWLAAIATQWGSRLQRWWDGVTPLVGVVIAACGLVVLQPNLSMAAIIGVSAGGVLVVAGLAWRHIAVLAFAGIGGLGLLAVQASYRAARVESFFGGGDRLEGGYQVTQALIGFGSGQWHGVGFGSGMQKFGYLPYAYSDFLFSTIGEEWGFVGSTVVLGLFLVIFWMGCSIAMTARDRFGQLLATGCTIFLTIGVVLHVGVNLAVLPATGIPLPFLSYGKTNLIMALLVVGILVNIGDQRDRPMPTRQRLPKRWADEVGLR